MSIFDRDHAVVAWATNHNWPTWSADGMFATRWNGQTFSPSLALMRPEDADRNTQFFALGILLASDGTPTVHWHENHPCYEPARYVAVTLPPTDSPVVQRLIAPTDGTVLNFAMTRDARDRLITVWSKVTDQQVDKYYQCYGGHLTAGGAIDGTIPISNPAGGGPAAFVTPPGLAPALAWVSRNRLVISALDES